MTTPINDIHKYFEQQWQRERKIDHDAIYKSTQNQASACAPPIQKIVINSAGSPVAFACTAQTLPPEKSKAGKPISDLLPNNHISSSIAEDTTKQDAKIEMYRELAFIDMGNRHKLAYNELCILRKTCRTAQQFEANAKKLLENIYSDGWQSFFSLPLAIKQMENEGVSLNTASADQLLAEPYKPVLEFSKIKL